MENFRVIQNNKYHNPLGRGKKLTDYTVIGEFDKLERAISCLGKQKMLMIMILEFITV